MSESDKVWDTDKLIQTDHLSDEQWDILADIFKDFKQSSALLWERVSLSSLLWQLTRSQQHLTKEREGDNMSAFLVNEDTLDLLASVAGWGREDLWVYMSEDILPPRGDLQFERGGNYYGERASSLIKEELRLENMASLWARYPKDANLFWEDREPKAFKRIYADQATVSQALGALACYEYQACESENWHNSFAFALCKAIRKALCSRISGDNWEYVRPADQAERVSLMDMMRGE